MLFIVRQFIVQTRFQKSNIKLATGTLKPKKLFFSTPHLANRNKAQVQARQHEKGLINVKNFSAGNSIINIVMATLVKIIH